MRRALDLTSSLHLPLRTGLTARKEQSEFFFKFTSFLYPGTIFRYDFTTQKCTVSLLVDLPTLSLCPCVM